MAIDLDAIDPTADPSLGLAAATVRPAPRPADLVGRTVALLDNRKEQGELILRTLGEALQQKYGAAKVVFGRKGHYSKPAPDALIDELAQEADVAVVALGG